MTLVSQPLCSFWDTGWDHCGQWKSEQSQPVLVPQRPDCWKRLRLPAVIQAVRAELFLSSRSPGHCVCLVATREGRVQWGESQWPQGPQNSHWEWKREPEVPRLSLCLFFGMSANWHGVGWSLFGMKLTVSVWDIPLWNGWAGGSETRGGGSNEDWWVWELERRHSKHPF